MSASARTGFFRSIGRSIGKTANSLGRNFNKNASSFANFVDGAVTFAAAPVGEGLISLADAFTGIAGETYVPGVGALAQVAT